MNRWFAKKLLQSTYIYYYFYTYSLIDTIFMHCIWKYTSVEIMPELKKKILNFGYGINFKYAGILEHSFDRFYVITKFISPTFNDLNFVPKGFDKKCDYLQADLSDSQYWKEYITKLKIFCEQIIPFVDFIRNKFLHIMVCCIKFLMKYH